MALFCQVDGTDATPALGVVGEVGGRGWDCLALRFLDAKGVLPIDFAAALSSGDDDACECALRLIASMCAGGRAVPVNVLQVCGAVLAPGPDSEVRFWAALALHELCLTQEGAAVELTGSGLLPRLMLLLPELSMRVRFHAAWTVLYAASVGSSAGPFFDGPADLASVSPLVTDMENGILMDLFIDAWDNVLRVAGPRACSYAARLVDQFPGASLWDCFAVDDPRLEQKAERFITRWFQVQGEE